MTASHGISLTSIVLNSPDPRSLARFYERLLGWKIDTDERNWVTLANPDRGVRMSFQLEDIYVRPVWPAKSGEQQMMTHLDIQAEDLEAACAHAKACGATLADFQPQDDVLVHLDPDGHVFCLFT